MPPVELVEEEIPFQPGAHLRLVKTKVREVSLPVAFMASYRGRGAYVPLVCGLDYRYVTSHGAYRQLLKRSISRAWSEGFERINFGIGATHEKTRYGCVPHVNHVFTQTIDGYSMEVLGQLMKAVRP